MDPFLVGVTVFFSFGLLWALGLWKARKRVHARMELAHLRLQLRDVRREEARWENTLTGWRGTTWVQLVGRPWGSTDVHAGIDAELPSELSLTPQRGKSPAPGGRDIQIGVAELDDRFQVRCANPAAAIRYLRDERTRSTLRGLIQLAPDAVVNEGEVRLTISPFEDSGQFERKVQAAIQYAQRLAEAADPEVVARRSAAAAAPAVAPSPSPLVQVSPEYLSRMRAEYGQRRLWLWYLYGAFAAMFVLVALGHEGLLRDFIPLARHARGWQVMWVVTIVSFGGLRWLLYRCPACSAPLHRRPNGSEGEAIRLWSKHVSCPSCGITLR